MTAKNIVYRTDGIARYFERHRRHWDEFYPSERWVFEAIARERPSLGAVLDVGCALGGLGTALAERFPLERYVGVDINRQAIEAAQARPAAIPSEFIAGDICDCAPLAGRAFDLVAALSVVDWNLDGTGILKACWERVAPGGHLVLSLRLTPGAGVRDPARSFQYIWHGAEPPPADAERAPYVVLNGVDALRLLASQVPAPARILGYGYWGRPSATARTLYERLVFAVFALRKAAAGETPDEPALELHLPSSVLLPAAR